MIAVTSLSIVIAIITTSMQPTPTETITVPGWATASTSASPTPSASPTNVQVLLSDIEGQNVVDVQTMLSEKGLKVLASPGEIVPADDPRVMDVYDAKPLGNLMSGSTIEIFYYVADTSGETPSPTPSQ